MSYPGPYGPPHTWPHPPPPHHPPPPFYPPPHHHPYHPPPPDGGATAAPPPYPYYVPGTMMVPVPIGVPPAPQPPTDQYGQPNNTYITNYIYHGETTVTDAVQVVESSGDFDWVPTTALMATTYTGRAVVGGHEGWDGSSLWVIRGWHNGDLIPGKMSVRHNAASITYDGKEIPLQNIEVLCAKPENLRWVPASNGSVPPGAIPGGRTANGETLYIGRARYQLSVTPGKVHPSHHSCYIAFGGTEVAHKMYDVLCRVS
ncbi:uncharacterized protein LOC142983668 [Anticarsia gemmatalis]|uniref:uncharacterized protein LOC142983668 n=1 Tax=Anticarsia gemmatalis TaxID=129554 RepID=UPI003F763C70